MTTGEAIQLLRGRRGLTRRELAKQAGVPVRILELLESDRVAPAGRVGEAVLLALATPEEDAIVALTIEVCKSLISQTVARVAAASVSTLH